MTRLIFFHNPSPVFVIQVITLRCWPSSSSRIQNLSTFLPFASSLLGLNLSEVVQLCLNYRGKGNFEPETETTIHSFQHAEEHTAYHSGTSSIFTSSKQSPPSSIEQHTAHHLQYLRPVQHLQQQSSPSTASSTKFPNGRP